MAGLPYSLSSIGLYRNSNKLRVPLSCQGGVYHGMGTGAPAIHRIEGHQSIRCRDCSKDGEEMEGSRGSPAGRSLTKVQGSAWECGTGHGRTQHRPNTTLPAGRRGGSWSRRWCLLQWRKSERAGCGNTSRVPGYIVGTGNGEKCHLAGHLKVELREGQVFDSGSLRRPPQPIQPVHNRAE